jgi:hypothetical protein
MIRRRYINDPQKKSMIRRRNINDPRNSHCGAPSVIAARPLSLWRTHCHCAPTVIARAHSHCTPTVIAAPTVIAGLTRNLLAYSGGEAGISISIKDN